MTILDKFIQQQRIKKALPYIPTNSVVIDIGCHKGELFHALSHRLQFGIGIDPGLDVEVHKEQYILLRGSMPGTFKPSVIGNIRR